MFSKNKTQTRENKTDFFSRLMRAKIWDNFKNESKPSNDSQVLSFVQMLADNFEQNHEMNQFDLDSMLSDTYKKGRVSIFCVL